MSRFLVSIAALVYVFLYAPLLVLAIFSFNESRFTGWQGWSLRWYRALAADTQITEAAFNSVVIAGATAAMATLLGTLAAYALWRRRSLIFSAGLYASLLTPEIVMGIGLLAWFQWAFRFGGMRLGMHTVIAAHVMFSLAYAVLVVMARLRTLDRTLEEAAMDLGASEWAAFRLVTLPAIAPAAVAAALIAFAVSFDDYVITSLVAGVDSETLPMVLYALAKRGANPVVNAISTLMVTGLGVVVLLSGRLARTR
jgi:ABC-type spermidine/putrescine transport system permease subunit II